MEQRERDRIQKRHSFLFIMNFKLFSLFLIMALASQCFAEEGGDAPAADSPPADGEKPAEEKPADEKPADEKPADEGAANAATTAAPADDAGGATTAASDGKEIWVKREVEFSNHICLHHESRCCKHSALISGRW
jgi:hypothetical protein